MPDADVLIYWKRVRPDRLKQRYSSIVMDTRCSLDEQMTDIKPVAHSGFNLGGGSLVKRLCLLSQLEKKNAIFGNFL